MSGKEGLNFIQCSLSCKMTLLKILEFIMMCILCRGKYPFHKHIFKNFHEEYPVIKEPLAFPTITMVFFFFFSTIICFGFMLYINEVCIMVCFKIGTWAQSNIVWEGNHGGHILSQQ